MRVATPYFCWTHELFPNSSDLISSLSNLTSSSKSIKHQMSETYSIELIPIWLYYKHIIYLTTSLAINFGQVQVSHKLCGQGTNQCRSALHPIPTACPGVAHDCHPWPFQRARDSANARNPGRCAKIHGILGRGFHLQLGGSSHLVSG